MEKRSNLFSKYNLKFATFLKQVYIDRDIYHINGGVIQGFPALRRAITTYVKKYCIFSSMLI